MKFFWWNIDENLPHHHGRLVIETSQGQSFLPLLVFRGDNNSLIPWIELYFPSPSSSTLLTFTFPSLDPSPPPPPTMAALCRAVTVQPRDGRQIKTTLFPLCSSHHPRLNLRFFIFFLIFLFSLELPGITWNQAPSQPDAVSFILFQSFLNLKEFEGCSIPL